MSCLLPHLQTQRSNLQVDQSSVSLISPVCFPSTSVMRRQKPKHQTGETAQNWHLHKKNILLMSLAAIEWTAVWFGIWARQEKGDLKRTLSYSISDGEGSDYLAIPRREPFKHKYHFYRPTSWRLKVADRLARSHTSRGWKERTDSGGSIYSCTVKIWRYFGT